MTYAEFHKIVNHFYRYARDNKIECITSGVLHKFVKEEDIYLEFADNVYVLLFIARKYDTAPETAEFLIKKLVDILIRDGKFLYNFDGNSVRRVIRKYDQRFSDEICKYILERINEGDKEKLSSKAFKETLIKKFRVLKNNKYATIAALL